MWRSMRRGTAPRSIGACNRSACASERSLLTALTIRLVGEVRRDVGKPQGGIGFWQAHLVGPHRRFCVGVERIAAEFAVTQHPSLFETHGAVVS